MSSTAMVVPELGGNTAGGNALMNTLKAVKDAENRDKAKATGDRFEVIIHNHVDGLWGNARRLYPGVTLRNGHLYRLRQQRCLEAGCKKRGFSLRDWHQRAVSRGWHPPTSVEHWGVGSVEPYVPQSLERDFGAFF